MRGGAMAFAGKHLFPIAIGIDFFRSFSVKAKRTKEK
jgi:hypothetical protein